MKFNHNQYAQALHEALQDTNPKDHDAVIENFIEILKQKGDLTEYEKIIAAYEVYDRDQRGITEVEVTTAQGATTVNKALIDEIAATIMLQDFLNK